MIASGSGNGPVLVYNIATLTPIASFAPYGTTSPGGVRVAAADLTGDGRAEIITVPGPGREPELKIFSGATFALLSTQLAFQPTYTGGVFVSASEAPRLGTVTNWKVTQRLVSVSGPAQLLGQRAAAALDRSRVPRPSDGGHAVRRRDPSRRPVLPGELPSATYTGTEDSRRAASPHFGKEEEGPCQDRGRLLPRWPWRLRPVRQLFRRRSTGNPDGGELDISASRRANWSPTPGGGRRRGGRNLCAVGGGEYLASEYLASSRAKV